MISLRPEGGHEVLRRAAARLGWRTIALSPWRIVPRDDDRARRALRDALAQRQVVFTSPAAVAAAAALLPLPGAPGRPLLAVGAGTARALRVATGGDAAVRAPARMDSEGLLAMPELAAATGVGLVCAPGGRDAVAAALQQRGARVVRAEVYDRVPLPPAPRALAALRSADGEWLLPLTSAGALAQVLATLPGDLAARLRAARVVAASERLATAARAAGCSGAITVAGDPRPARLLAAARPPAT